MSFGFKGLEGLHGIAAHQMRNVQQFVLTAGIV
jgi:hypothetical protein